MAAYLAIWSPAMCCCGFKHIIGRITGTETQGCHSSRAVTTDLVRDAGAALPGGCCASQDEDQSRAGEPESCVGEPATSDPDNRCRCHESVESKVRLDTGSKIILPALTKNSPGLDLAPLPIISMAVTSPIARTDWPPGGDQPWLNSGQTLLARRCLLLI